MCQPWKRALSLVLYALAALVVVGAWFAEASRAKAAEQAPPAAEKPVQTMIICRGGKMVGIALVVRQPGYFTLEFDPAEQCQVGV